MRAATGGRNNRAMWVDRFLQCYMSVECINVEWSGVEYLSAPHLHVGGVECAAQERATYSGFWSLDA